MTAFLLSGLSHEPFEPLFAMTDAELARHDALRVVATDDVGFPCRVTLEDAPRGEARLLRMPRRPARPVGASRRRSVVHARRSGVRRIVSGSERAVR